MFLNVYDRNIEDKDILIYLDQINKVFNGKINVSDLKDKEDLFSVFEKRKVTYNNVLIRKKDKKIEVHMFVDLDMMKVVLKKINN